MKNRNKIHRNVKEDLYKDGMKEQIRKIATKKIQKENDSKLQNKVWIEIQTLKQINRIQGEDKDTQKVENENERMLMIE